MTEPHTKDVNNKDLMNNELLVTRSKSDDLFLT